MEVRKAGVLIRLEPGDEAIASYRFDPCDFRHFWVGPRSEVAASKTAKQGATPCLPAIHRSSKSRTPVSETGECRCKTYSVIQSIQGSSNGRTNAFEA